MVAFCIGSAYFISIHMVERICPRIHMTRIHTEIQSSKVIKGYVLLSYASNIDKLEIKFFCFQLRFDATDTVIKCKTQYYFSFSSFICNKTLLRPKDTMLRQIIWTTIHHDQSSYHIWKLHSQSISILKMHEHILKSHNLQKSSNQNGRIIWSTTHHEHHMRGIQTNNFKFIPTWLTFTPSFQIVNVQPPTLNITSLKNGDLCSDTTGPSCIAW